MCVCLAGAVLFGEPRIYGSEFQDCLCCCDVSKLKLECTSTNYSLPTSQRKQPVTVPSLRRSLWMWSTPRTRLMGGSP